MEKIYLWLVHDHNTQQQLELSEAQINANGLPCESMELTKRYYSFVVDRAHLDDFWRKIKIILPCECKAYEFSEEEMLLGEYYLDPSRNTSSFIPWIDTKISAPARQMAFRYFFFVDFNATFAVTDELLGRYLNKLQCQFNVLDCVKTEPAFYTGDNYYAAKLKVQMQYADVLATMGLLFKMVVESHSLEDEGSMTILYGQFSEERVRVFDRWCIPNIWTLSHDASFGHEMPLFCQWEFDQAIRKHTET
ncbi:hypothetical protein [Methylomonas koyamae]|uniref:hypothetical protein n=1 Tax=Methylomonas koyamae TaxID=702114 RepID=UPI00112D0992|nr:hypothetical protein [Methylomonas koyamae]TPQ24750.1 hypothetical protein C2U68_18010 [Methylomonas koyamae]